MPIGCNSSIYNYFQLNSLNSAGIANLKLLIYHSILYRVQQGRRKGLIAETQKAHCWSFSQIRDAGKNSLIPIVSYQISLHTEQYCLYKKQRYYSLPKKQRNMTRDPKTMAETVSLLAFGKFFIYMGKYTRKGKFQPDLRMKIHNEDCEGLRQIAQRGYRIAILHSTQTLFDLTFTLDLLWAEALDQMVSKGPSSPVSVCFYSGCCSSGEGI